MTKPKTYAVWGTSAVLIASLGVLAGWQTSAGASSKSSGAVSAAAKPVQTQPPTSSRGSGNNGSGGGNGAGTGSPGKALTVTATPPVNLEPGMTAPFVVQVTNPNNQAVQLTEVKAGVTSVAPAACLTSWFSIPTSTARVDVPAGQTVPVTLQLSMAGTSTNQDACKAATYRFSFTATGQSA